MSGLETKELLEGLRNASNDDLSNLKRFLLPSTTKLSKFDFFKAIDGLTKAAQQQEFCDSLKTILQVHFDSKSEDEDESTSIKEEDKLATLFLITKLSKLFLEHESRLAPHSLFETVIWLHNQIFSLSHNQVLQNEICELCELWFIQDRSGKEAIVPQMIPFLLNRCLSSESKISDIKRLLSCKDALLLLDLEDDSASGVRIMVQRCFIHFLFLTSNEGKKFLVYCLSHLSMVPHIHNTIKAALVQSLKWQISGYSEIYFKSWKNSEGHNKLRIEQICIQDLVDASIHCKNTSVLKAVRSVLKYLVEQKVNFSPIEEMVQRLFSPILFRGLQVANPQVRENSLYQLSIVFPLVSSDQGQKEFDMSLQEQFKLIVDALEDSHPMVRRQAVLALGRILSLYWEILQPQALHSIIQYLVNNIAFDKSSPLVREAVPKAMIAIIENPLSHTLFHEKKYLAKLAPLLFDTSEKVRHACILLLEAVKKVKKLKYYEVVVFDRLLDSLATESSPKLKYLLSKLLFSAYWPYPRHPVKELVSRALSLVNDHPRAAVSFYTHAAILDDKSHPTPVLVAVQFISKLWTKVIIPWIQENNDSSKGKKSAAKKTGKASANAQESTSDTDSSFLNENSSKRVKTHDHDGDDDAQNQFKWTKETALAVVEIIASVWDAVDSHLDPKDHQNIIQQLITTFLDQDIMDLYRILPHPSIARIAGRLPAENLAAFSTDILDKLLSDKTSLDQQNTLLQCIFAWGDQYTSKFFQKILTMIQVDKQGKPKNPSSVSAGLRLISMLFTSEAWIRGETLESEVKDQILETLQKYQLLAESVIDDSDLSYEYLPDAICLYYRILIHESYILKKQTITPFEELIDWIQSTIYPSLLAATRTDELDQEIDEKAPDNISLQLQIVSNALLVLNDVAALEIQPVRNFEKKLSGLLSSILMVRSDKPFLKLATAVAWKLIARYQRAATDQTQFGARFSDFVLLTILRDCTIDKKYSVSSLKYLISSYGGTSKKRAAKDDSENVTNIVLGHLWTMVEAQLTDSDFTHEIDIDDQLPPDISAIISSFSNSTPMVSELVSWMRRQLENQNTSKAAVWTSIQICALAAKPIKRPTQVGISSMKHFLVDVMAKMREADEEEATLRSRCNQLLTSPAFHTK